MSEQYRRQRRCMALVIGAMVVVMVFLLSDRRWPQVRIWVANQLDLVTWTADDLVARSLTKKQRAEFQTLLKALVGVLEKKNISYFLYAGSLLGSWRHHEMIAWDDDIDILIDNSRRADVIKDLESLEPTYTVLATAGPHKFFSKRGRPIWGEKHLWPFIDVTFYGQNSKHLWDLNPYWSYIKHKLTDVFPLHKRPFEGMMVNAPRSTLTNLKTVFGRTDTCSTGGYSHVVETAGRVVYVKCKTLKNLYPFVHRKFVRGKMQETLMKGDKIIHVIEVDEPEEDVGFPYRL